MSCSDLVPPPASSRLRSKALYLVRRYQAKHAALLLAKWAKEQATQQSTGAETIPLGPPIGVLLYRTTNLGDEIQSLAAASLLPSAGFVGVDRDYLRSSKAFPPLPLLLNGWFTHGWGEWPPHDSLMPLFYGFHAARQVVVSPRSLSYLRRHAPIGCRDYYTASLLAKNAVPAFFSGCPTACMRAVSPPERKGIFFVDCGAKNPDGHIRSCSHLMQYIPKDLISQAFWLSHNVPKWMSHLYFEKFKRAVRYLELYKRAELVVTTRLHCALPCLAFGTPCIFLSRSPHSDSRFGGLVDHLYVASSPKDLETYPWRNPVVMPPAPFVGPLRQALIDRLASLRHSV